MEESERRERSDSVKSDELTGLVRNEASVSEAGNGASVSEQGEKEKKKKKKKKTTKKKKGKKAGNGASVSEQGEKKKKKKKKKRKSITHSLPSLPVEDHKLPDDTNVEPVEVSKKRQRLDSGKPHELTGLAKSGASVSEAGNSSTEPDHSSCTSKKKKLSSGNIRVTSKETQLDAENNSCKLAESIMPQTSEKLTAMDINSPALNNDRAQPICKPIWRGSMFLKNGNSCSIDGLVAHLSTLACGKVHEKASSLHALLSAEMFPRLEIWPDSFLKDGPPTDESIALYFFPSSESKDEKVYYSLVGEMKKNDLAMRCVLDNVDLLLFTSYQLPMHCWTFYSKEYLWGIFRRRKISRR
ncbi:hypothetical protein EUTSA_v10011612mg [Eutrema salsugineum]|uniref:AIPP2-like SPOC-like domain-containing protein n=1 Tax=Eutrema salsugineum TaxID=72664 RepID=V4MI98_EUTSA|nr:hypothetical protein EUTSA_v10011612mg [Eutrema salsugineum]